MPYFDYRETYEDKVLTNYAQQFSTGGFIADQVAPFVPVDKPSSNYYVMSREQARVYDTAREAGTKSIEVDDTFTTESYACKQHRVSTVIPVEVVKNANRVLAPRMRAVKFLKNILYTGRERRVAELLIGVGSTFPGVNVSDADKWDNYTSASSTPLEDIVQGINSIFQGLNLMATDIILPFDVASALSVHPDIKENYIYHSSEMLTNIALPNMLKGLRVHVPTGVFLTSPKGKADTVAPIWGKNAIVIYTNPNPGLEGTNTINTFTDYEARIRRWMDEPRESEVIEYGMSTDERIISNVGAYVLRNVIS